MRPAARSKRRTPRSLFERFDLKSHCRLGEEKMFRGLAKVQVLSHGTKHLQAKILQLCHCE